MIILTFTMTACHKEEKKETIKEEPGKANTVIDPIEQEEEKKPALAVDRIDLFDQVNITDWLDEDRVIASKENTTLDKMSLAELSELYPRSLYLLNLTSKEYKLLKAEEEAFLDGATLSGNKKFLLYSSYSLGDPSFHIMNMETLEEFEIKGEPIAGAMTAKWADNDTVIGTAYSKGAYLADSAGNITLVEELKEEALYLHEKLGDSIYYNTAYDSALMKLNLKTGEKISLDLEQVYGIVPSPDKKQLLVLQTDGAKNILFIYNPDSKERVTIAEGAEFGGVSWSPDQRRIAYSLKEDGELATAGSLFVYDMLTGVNNRLAVDREIISTSFSPGGSKLIFTEWDGTYYKSSLIYLK